MPERVALAHEHASRERLLAPKGHILGRNRGWKLLIDESCRGSGYGTATIDAVVDYLRTRPGADVLDTSCTDDPGSPRGFYVRSGFTDTGRVMWDEKRSRAGARRSSA